jgi:hypothetical protein
MKEAGNSQLFSLSFRRIPPFVERILLSTFILTSASVLRAGDIVVKGAFHRFKVQLGVSPATGFYFAIVSVK